MDTAILCGGYGTRLAGLWDEPKCLVPLGDGHPILAHLLCRIYSLRPRCIHLLTGHKGLEVVTELRSRGFLSPKLLVSCETPRGTAVAMRSVLSQVIPPLMVLNGDTLPRYPLSDLMRIWNAESPDVLSAQCGGVSAGATILSAEALQKLRESTATDFDVLVESECLGEIRRVLVAGFLDVGTPRGFELASGWMI